MKPIVIYTYDFDMGIGGIKVMHKLCHILNTMGYESYLMPIHIHSTFTVYYDNTPIITQEILENLSDCIVVYPEGIQYNPLESKYVVRWVLGPPRHEDIATWSGDDLVFWYMDYYYVDFVGQRNNTLFVTENHSDIFYNRYMEREGSCYSIRKCKNPQLIHPQDSIFIPYHGAGNLLELAQLFNKTKIFYCYDNYTFLNVQAAMCGCISVVIPDGTKSKEEWLQGSRLNKYGVAYGLNDIERAVDTLPFLFKEMDQIELETNTQIRIFVNKCLDKFK